MNYRESQQQIKYKNAWGYIRVSSDGQTEEDRNGLPRQRDRIKKIADDIGVPLIRIYEDGGVSASTGANLLAEWKTCKTVANKGDIIIIEDPDRQTRLGLTKWLNECDQLFTKGVHLHDGYKIIKSLDQAESPENIMRPVMAKADHVRRCGKFDDSLKMRLKKRQEGKFAITGRVPYWLIPSEDMQKYVVDDVKASAVRRMFELYMSGHSVREICDILNKDGISRTIGKVSGKWYPSIITAQLKSRSAIGYYAPYLKTDIKCKNDSDKCYAKYIQQTDREVKLYPPIIADDIFYAVQTKLNERKKYRGPRKTFNINLFKGLVECASCGNKLYKVQQHNKYWYYLCSTGQFGYCNTSAINAIQFENSFKALLTHSDIMSALLATTVVSPLKLETLQGQLAEVKAKQLKMVTLLENDADERPSDMLYKKLKEYEIEERRLQREIDTEVAVLRSSAPETILIQEYADNQFDAKWNDPEARLQIREVIRTVVDKIIMNKQNKCYTVHWKHDKHVPVQVQLTDTGYFINNMTFVGKPKAIAEFKYPIDKPLIRGADGVLRMPAS